MIFLNSALMSLKCLNNDFIYILLYKFQFMIFIILSGALRIYTTYEKLAVPV